MAQNYLNTSSIFMSIALLWEGGVSALLHYNNIQVA